MFSLIVIHADFESHWPFVAGQFFSRWQAQGETALIRLPRGDQRPLGEIHLGELDVESAQVTRLACLGVPVTVACLKEFTSLKEATFPAVYGPTQLSPECAAYLQQAGVKVYDHHSEGFWGHSVAEFALALTLSALRRLPQAYHEMLISHVPWERYAAHNNQGPGTWGEQFADDLRFASGTAAGKRVRIVGVGNIGSRYASFMHMLGADVAAWDPYATEPCFHRSRARRQWHLDELVQDAEVFAPMVPLTRDTRGLVTAAHINALPKGCLVVLVTRAHVCDMAALRQRVLADELGLAADVFDVEPLPLDDPLLGRANVVHTPHLAGRTLHANQQWAESLLAQFRPVISLEIRRLGD
jgi:phosphoglycerate dehydrogenase-like enzyme